MQDNELKNLLKSVNIPPPSDAARKAAMQAAQQAFDAHEAEKEKNRQGSAGKARPTRNGHAGWPERIGRLSMKKLYIATGSLATLAVALVVTTQMSTIMGPLGFEEKQKAADTAASAQVKGAQVNTFAAPQQQAENKPAPLAPPAPPAPPPPPPAQVSAVGTGAMMAAPLEKDFEESEMAAGAVAGQSVAMDAAPMPAAAPTPMESRTRAARVAASSPAYQLKGVDMIAPSPMPPVSYEGSDKFEKFTPNAVKLVSQEPVSTFSIDVNTSSYSFVRRMINGGSLPNRDAVRPEEMINYFAYDYPLPENKEQPFSPSVAVYPTPWNANTKLMRIGIKGYDIARTGKPRSNLVFLIDVSGSMSPADRLPLVKTSLRMLLDELNPQDTVGIVVYAGQVGTVLEPTPVSDKSKIADALNRLESGGSTAGGEGIRQAYNLAQAHFDKEAVNRVILATDGDFNVGITDTNELQSFVESKRQTGIFLSILGFGQGNYNDAMMQRLAQHGNGNAAYIDNLNEARKVLVEEAGATLFPIAKDVKIQVEFNPNMVSEYRLIGYESRLLNREDFNNDAVDAGEVGAGHAVTAIYELTPAGSSSNRVDELRYGKTKPEPVVKKDDSGEYAFLKIRYKLPAESQSKLMTTPITAKNEVADIQKADDDVRFATAVAAFGQLLKGDTHLNQYSYDDVVTLAEGARGKDSFGYRAEFLNLVRLARSEQSQR